jgi:threonine aldolase
MKIFDYRSDTVTKPSPEMWEVLKNLNNSDLGDDVEQEDPSVIELEEKAANLVGKEASLFVTSGTMGNLLSLLSQTTPGDEILLEEHSHIYKWEVGGAARIGGLMVKLFQSDKGLFNPNSLSDIVRGSDIHEPTTRLIALENTHNYHGGKILPPDLLAKTRKFATVNNLKFHLDGARIFNAAVGAGIPVTEYTKHVDSIQFCLSKGLCCPIGSMIAGSPEFIEKARKFRKMVGGGWRQAGILAALGNVALEEDWILRLQEDHKNAKLLYHGLTETGLPFQIPDPDTNMVVVQVPKPEKISHLIQDLSNNGILAHSMGPNVRLVTHFGLSSADIEESIPIIRKVMKKHW